MSKLDCLAVRWLFVSRKGIKMKKNWCSQFQQFNFDCLLLKILICSPKTIQLCLLFADPVICHDFRDSYILHLGKVWIWRSNRLFQITKKDFLFREYYFFVEIIMLFYPIPDGFIWIWTWIWSISICKNYQVTREWSKADWLDPFFFN